MIEKIFKYTNRKNENFELILSDKDISYLCSYFSYFDERYFMVNRCWKPLTYEELRVELGYILERNNGYNHIQYIIKQSKGLSCKDINNIGYRWVADMIKSPMTEWYKGNYNSLPFLCEYNGELRVFCFVFNEDINTEVHEGKLTCDNGDDIEGKLTCDSFKMKALYILEGKKLVEMPCNFDIVALMFDNATRSELCLDVVDEDDIEFTTYGMEVNYIEYSNKIEDIISEYKKSGKFSEKDMLEALEIIEKPELRNLYRMIMDFIVNQDKFVTFDKTCEILGYKKWSQEWIELVDSKSRY